MNRIHAPFTPRMVKSLNEFQASGRMHPFTAERGPGGEECVLIATEDGWVKEVGGPVVQTWAWDFMTTWQNETRRGAPLKTLTGFVRWRGMSEGKMMVSVALSGEFAGYAYSFPEEVDDEKSRDLALLGDHVYLGMEEVARTSSSEGGLRLLSVRLNEQLSPTMVRGQFLLEGKADEFFSSHSLYQVSESARDVYCRDPLPDVCRSLRPVLCDKAGSFCWGGSAGCEPASIVQYPIYRVLQTLSTDERRRHRKKLVSLKEV